MIKDHYLVRRRERNEVRHVLSYECYPVGHRYAHADRQFIMTIYQLEMVLQFLQSAHTYYFSIDNSNLS